MGEGSTQGISLYRVSGYIISLPLSQSLHKANRMSNSAGGDSKQSGKEVVVAKGKHCIETAKKAYHLIHMQGDAEERQ